MPEDLIDGKSTLVQVIACNLLLLQRLFATNTYLITYRMDRHNSPEMGEQIWISA